MESIRQRLARHRALGLDVAIALAAFAVPAFSFGARSDAEPDAPELGAVGLLLVALSSLPLVGRRRAPLAVFAVTAAASAALSALGFPSGPPIGATVALYFLALDPDRVRAPKWAVAATVVTLLAVHVAAAGVGQDELPTVPLLFGIVVWGGAWVIGDRVRMRRARVAELLDRAHRAEREAERERRLAAAEERTRIARDLHDSAGHAINVILVQAGAARLLAEQDPRRSREALETIEDVARETLGEIDQLVRALREDGAASVEPPYGLAAVKTLLERHRAAGLRVDVRIQGEQRQLPPAVDQAAYRILQEALTNAARHGQERARVELGFGSRSLEVKVTNPVHPDAAVGNGHGIVGMRERAALLGGTLDADVADGSFRVAASLPYDGENA